MNLHQRQKIKFTNIKKNRKKKHFFNCVSNYFFPAAHPSLKLFFLNKTTEKYLKQESVWFMLSHKKFDSLKL